jgi:prepilin-type N-terminal cleavage/methylation domain-containing protein
MKSTHLHVARRGFTLVELLAVIVIIGILASMALYAASVAMVSAKNGKIAMDIKMIETDLQSYYGTKGSYPPDLAYVSTIPGPARAQGIRSHLSKMAPRYTQPNTLTPDTPLNGADLTQSRLNIASEALVFFLGGYSAPAGSGSTKLLGFRADPTKPFVADVAELKNLADKPGWKKGSLGFDEVRLVDTDNDGWYEYLPPYGNLPYVYFNAKSYMHPGGGTVKCDIPGMPGALVTPYGSDVTADKFANPKTFQLLAAGQDSMFTTAEPTVSRRFPSGAGYTSADNDNLTNFAERKLEDAIPQ